MEIVGGNKLGIGLVKWMGEDKDAYGRKGRSVVWDMFSRYAAANMEIIHPLFAPVFPTPNFGLQLQLSP